MRLINLMFEQKELYIYIRVYNCVHWILSTNDQTIYQQSKY